MGLAVIGLLLLSPLLALISAGFRALVLFWPTMLVFGGAHAHIDWIPALSWEASFLVIMLLSLLIPTGDSKSNG